MWPWPLTSKTVPLLGYPKVIPNTKFEHFGIIRFGVMPRTNKQIGRQTDRQTDGLEYATHADRHMVVGVRNKKN